MNFEYVIAILSDGHLWKIHKNGIKIILELDYLENRKK